jgi:ABC-type polysaccharide/polyol phosphate transport system ATPase subunit
MSSAITFEGVSKHYRGARTYRALREDLVGAAGRVVGIKRSPRRTVRALDGIDLEVAEGEALGLIGSNGAGKTTLLKLACRVTYPTVGRIRVRGRVGALIEVGSGMHPELTGRENVRLYGRILGLSSREIESRFDDIVEFAGIGAALDQPVKQFSSGMQLRLGFAVASHLEPDVLLVDEAIAVGDQGFQQRCVERMARLVREGRTLVFVSHDMTAIEALCSRAILIENGQVRADGPARDVVGSYLKNVDRGRAVSLRRDAAGIVGTPEFEITKVTIHDAEGAELVRARADQPTTVRVHFSALEPVEHPSFSVGFGDGRIGAFSSASMLIDGQSPAIVHGNGYVDCTFETLPLRPQVYEVWVGVRGEHGFGNLVGFQPVSLLEIEGEVPNGKAAYSWGLKTPVDIPYHWNVEAGDRT